MEMQATDSELITKAQNGEREAFDFLVRRYQLKLSKLISRYIRDPSEALDVTQEVFIKVYRALPRFRGESSFYTWLYRIAINTAKSYSLGQIRRPPDTDIDINTAEIQMLGRTRLKEDGTPEHLLICSEIEEAVFKIVDELPDDLRTAIMLRELEGFSYEEIANVMNCPIGTIRSRIFRAREAIDQEILPMLKY